MFTNCSCISDGRAEAGLCDERCSNLIPWSIFIFLHGIIGGLIIAPNIIAVIRSVDDRDKPAALGLNTCLGSGLAWGLSPILYGKVLDASCLIWQYPCSSSGACELYDFRSLRLSFHGTSIAMKFAALVCTICLVILTRNWHDWKYSKKPEPQRSYIVMTNASRCVVRSFKAVHYKFEIVFVPPSLSITYYIALFSKHDIFLKKVLCQSII
ncbi:solute carrier organic anion transporter family member 2B1-like isoform X4 [Ostrea edulis]|nr:solute carrier organic anion transporter family member 2B1-like isoform X4 [Ostrea edulis]